MEEAVNLIGKEIEKSGFGAKQDAISNVRKREENIEIFETKEAKFVGIIINREIKFEA